MCRNSQVASAQPWSRQVARSAWTVVRRRRGGTTWTGRGERRGSAPRRVRESGGAGWQVRSVQIRGDGGLMMSRRRRMNAAASRSAIVFARAGEDDGRPFFVEWMRLRRVQQQAVVEIRHRTTELDDQGASCEKRVRPSFCLRRRGERGSADGTQRSQDGSDRHRRRGAGDAGVHGACLPVMRASTREEMRRISFTSRSSSRLFSIHSRYRPSSSSVSFKPTVFPRALRVQWW